MIIDGWTILSAMVVIGCLIAVIILSYKTFKLARVTPRPDDEYVWFYNELRELVYGYAYGMKSTQLRWSGASKDHFYMLRRGTLGLFRREPNWFDLATIEFIWSTDVTTGKRSAIAQVKIFEILRDNRTRIPFASYAAQLRDELDVLAFEPSWPIEDQMTRASKLSNDLAYADIEQLTELLDELRRNQP